MNIKALPSMGQRLFCCFCFVESAVCSTFAERIIRGCFRGCTCLKCTNRARSTPVELRGGCVKTQLVRAESPTIT